MWRPILYSDTGNTSPSAYWTVVLSEALIYNQDENYTEETLISTKRSQCYHRESRTDNTLKTTKLFMLLVMFLSNLYITCYISFCPAQPQISGYFDKHLSFLLLIKASLKCNLNLSLNGRQYKCGELLNSYFH